MSRRDNIDAFKPEDAGKTPEEKGPKFLKGNYEVPGAVEKPAAAAGGKSSTQTFEDFARQRLGGSIAFVMKANTFVWKGDKPAEKNPEEPEKK